MDKAELEQVWCRYVQEERDELKDTLAKAVRRLRAGDDPDEVADAMMSEMHYSHDKAGAR